VDSSINYAGQVSTLSKYKKAIATFEQEFERQPTPEELSEIMDLPVEKVLETMKVSSKNVSVDAPFQEGEDGSLLDVLENPDSPKVDRGLISESLSTEIHRAFSTLSEREREILKYSYGIGTQELTLEEIGNEFGLTRERVRQIKEKAIRKLRHTSKSNILKTYLG